MIPKVIHYCWFGKGTKNDTILKCIESWKINCPDYEIVEWNEENFDITSNLYCKQAYENKKWAFVTDYVRLYVLYNFGGIYMDTDVEVVKNIDLFLNDDAFSGFENKKHVPTGIIGSTKGNRVIEELLNDYKNKRFLVDNELDLTTNVITITKYFKENGLKFNNEKQVINGFSMYPRHYFCQSNEKERKRSEISDSIYTIHHFQGSWKSEKSKKREKSILWKYIAIAMGVVSNFIKLIFGEKYVKFKNKLVKRWLN